MVKLFGTNGVRGVVNKELTAEMALRLGRAIGSFFNGTVAIATDTRNSGPMIKSAAAAGLMSVGANVIDLGIVPTPAMQYYVRTHSLSGGVMITASHNPPQFNGIKCADREGRELTREDEEKIESLYAQGTEIKAWDSVGTRTYDASAPEAYVNAVIGHVNADAIRKAKLTVVADCVNGAACVTTPMLLERLGVKSILLNADPKGIPNHPSEPTGDNLKDLMFVVKKEKADLGTAHDGDADRTVFVTDGGIYMEGDESLAVMAKFLLSKKKGLVITPVSTSSMLEDVVRKAGGKISYTAVGSPAIAKAMHRDNAIFGGEGNGGLIFPEHLLCRDGAMAIAKMLECIVTEGPLSEQTEALPKYHTVKRKVYCPDRLKDALVEFLKGENKSAKKDTTDGLKLIYGDGWVLMRPSGTEPLFRITSESKEKDAAVKRADETEAKAEDYIRNMDRSV
ncbi:MAG: phosphoglucosamine mutase [Methanomassiliicoccaceae archaeon]|jgi:phosphomannomutase/phosphoglucomutase|nr:phosphoglucosamine mutase [Methanomassiliicoccaceae archaeon]